MARLIHVCGGSIGRATVTDYYATPLARRFVMWFHFLGFELGECHVSDHLQFSNTCAFVAAHVASMQSRAGTNWSNIDTREAAENHVWQRGHDVLQLPRNPEMFREDTEIKKLLEAWDDDWEFTRTLALDWSMAEVGKYVRALAFNRGIINDPHLRESGRDAIRVAERIRDGDDQFPKRQITNTKIASQRGFHWSHTR
eukprot:m.335326 g.335326  ORF g.335326 m.335326 type:complete len:198 (-) comp16529_c0_seq62:2048-2641(-)